MEWSTHTAHILGSTIGPGLQPWSATQIFHDSTWILYHRMSIDDKQPLCKNENNTIIEQFISHLIQQSLDYHPSTFCHD